MTDFSDKWVQRNYHVISQIPLGKWQSALHRAPNFEVIAKNADSQTIPLQMVAHIIDEATNHKISDEYRKFFTTDDRISFFSNLVVLHDGNGKLAFFLPLEGAGIGHIHDPSAEDIAMLRCVADAPCQKDEYGDAIISDDLVDQVITRLQTASADHKKQSYTHTPEDREIVRDRLTRLIWATSHVSSTTDDVIKQRFRTILSDAGFAFVEDDLVLNDLSDPNTLFGDYIRPVIPGEPNPLPYMLLGVTDLNQHPDLLATLKSWCQEYNISTRASNGTSLFPDLDYAKEAERIRTRLTESGYNSDEISTILDLAYPLSRQQQGHHVKRLGLSARSPESGQGK